MEESEGETATDAEGGHLDWHDVFDVLRRGLRWLRDLHRGLAYTGHLPRRRD